MLQMEVNESTKLTLDLKTIVIVVTFCVSMTLMYATIQSDIKDAKELPIAEVSKTEYELKDKLIREAIMTTQEDVKEIKETLEKLEVRIYDMKN
ncbi:MAG: hypothetical protein Unbinned5858contig1001_1 [Prokaryotic dsDNA virus sp.]|nr:MAG: hypothetical protein Unbinned5858contig1001_1 [Prokaryotic dsDNA virus sp.]